MRTLAGTNQNKGMPSYFSDAETYEEALTHVSQRRREAIEEGKKESTQRGIDEFLQLLLARLSSDLQARPGSVQSGLLVS